MSDRHICTQRFHLNRAIKATSILPSPLTSSPSEILIRRPDKYLLIDFLGGTDLVKSRVCKHIGSCLTRWGVKFTLPNRCVDQFDPNIYISFVPGGSWSFVGLDKIVQGSPTMNFGSLDENTTDVEIELITSHLMGHALGGVHALENSSGNSDDQTLKPGGFAYSPTTISVLDGEEVEREEKETIDGMSTPRYTVASEDGILTPQYTVASEDGNLTPRYTVASEDSKDSVIGNLCSPSPHGLSFGEYSTNDQRTWETPHSWNEKKIAFSAKYPSSPAITVGLTGLDINSPHSSAVRVACFADNISRDSFSIHTNTWEASTLYFAACTWLETTTQQHPEFQVGACRHVWSPITETVTPIVETIQFGRPYHQPPKIVVWLNFIDTSKLLYIKATAENITTHGFELKIQSGSGASIQGAGASWIAYPADRPGTASGTVGTDDIRSSKAPKTNNTGDVVFPDGCFKEAVPKVLMAVNYLSYDDSAFLRFYSYADRIWKGGFRWNLNAWDATLDVEAGMQYLAFV